MPGRVGSLEVRFGSHKVELRKCRRSVSIFCREDLRLRMPSVGMCVWSNGSVPSFHRVLRLIPSTRLRMVVLLLILQKKLLLSMVSWHNF
mmetsp:Transcript_20307/g.30282  ORF Transcript_20307/g.30282 Transcript_20307/m.30282 type:complete len:90 (-) Transcript_20307:68-337(-)